MIHILSIVNSIPLLTIQNQEKLDQACILQTSAALFDLSSVANISFSNGDTTLAINNLCNYQRDPYESFSTIKTK